MNIAQLGQNEGTKYEYNNTINYKQNSVSNIKDRSLTGNVPNSNSNANTIVNYYKKEFSNLTDMSSDDIKNTVQSVLSKMGEDDYASLISQGVSPESMSLDYLLVSIEQIKQTRGNESILGNSKVSLNDNLLNNAKKICPDTDIINKLADAFGNHNVPVNETNLTNGLNAYNKLDKFGNLSSEAIDYLLKQGKLPTIENIYKAQYSNSENVDNTSKITDEEWKKLSSQVDNILKQEGLEPDKKNKDLARDLISKDILLNRENIVRAQELHNIDITKNLDKIINNITGAIKNGKNADQALVINSVEQIYEDVKQTLEKVEDTHISEVIKSGSELTIDQLKKEIYTSNRNKMQETPNQIKKTYTNDEIKAKRELEEIRLKLTLEAARKLSSKGFNIETEKLNKIVKELREIELGVARNTLEYVKAETTPENVELLQETVNKVNEIKSLPLYTIGRVSISTEVPTLNLIHSEGNNLSQQLKNHMATSSYDTMMTTPRQDLGDSLNKAFANIDSIIADLGLEKNEANQNAIKILGYNQIEINEGNISKVKQLYQNVMHTLKNFTPGVAALMIKEGINPLKTEINQLNKEINLVKDEYGLTEQEKIGKFIVEAEKSGNINQEEKKSLLGLYRLINTVNKTQGKAVGMLMKQGREITLTNLLSAAKLLKTKGVNVEINDKFGSLEKVEYEKEPISAQLETLTQGQAFEREEAKINYQQELLSNIMESISPAKLKEIAKNNDILNMSLEKLSEYLAKLDNEEFSKEDKIYAAEKVTKLQELQNADARTFALINEYNIPNSVKNILAAQMVLQQDYSIYKDIKKKLSDLGSDDKKIEDIINNVDENNGNVDSMLINLEKVDNILDNMLQVSINKDAYSTDLDKILDIKNNVSLLKELGQQQYFQVPFRINGNIEQLNIKLEKGSGETQNINAVVKTETLGNINLNLVIEKGNASIQVIAESSESIKILKETKEKLVGVLENIGLVVRDVDYIMSVKTESILEKTAIGYARNGFEVVI
ncbi:MAG: hypothetical protein K0R15_999 [Clostridiales bacterium]|jgi:hypothetical protein|nr:hypothetical protein [Clostridiales bacterium]